MTYKELLAEDGLLKQLTKALIERCLETEMEEHLGYPKHAKCSDTARNSRNGSSRKTLTRPSRDHKARSRLLFHVIVKPALSLP